MRGRGRMCLLGVLGWLMLASGAFAQFRPTSVTALPGAKQAEEPELSPPDFSSGVSFLDNVFPRTQVRVRAEANYHANRPQRAEYIWAKGVFPGSPGPSLPETNLSYQEMTSYMEYALGPWFSFFLETPTRWVNPERNGNAHGYGDTNFGARFMTYAGDDLQLTLQLRAYAPTGNERVLGNHHWSIEPALLGHYQLAGFLQLEGEVRYWVPLNGTDFAGDVLRYGLGLSYGQRSASEMWVMPVIEAVGWTVMGGRQFIAHGPNTLEIAPANGDTILNVYGGVRWGLGERADIYTGYGRSLTGDRWFRDTLRLEIRFLF